MHINDVHYKKQGGDSGNDEGRPAPKSIETPEASVSPSQSGAKLASGSFGQKLAQTGSTGPILYPPQHLNSMKHPITPKIKPATQPNATPQRDHGCQMAIAKFLDCMCLALRA